MSSQSRPVQPDLSTLSPEEQRLFRMYGKLPIAKRLTGGRKYFDSGDYALAKAGAPNVTVGTIPAPLSRGQNGAAGLHQSTSPLNDANIHPGAQGEFGLDEAVSADQQQQQQQQLDMEQHQQQKQFPSLAHPDQQGQPLPLLQHQLLGHHHSQGHPLPPSRAHPKTHPMAQVHPPTQMHSQTHPLAHAVHPLAQAASADDPAEQDANGRLDMDMDETA